MSKLLALLLFICSLNSTTPNWDYVKKFELKKDEIAEVIINNRANSIEDKFTFSWTLYDNTNIIIHTKFRKFPRQITLSLRRGLEIYKQIILYKTNLDKNDEVGIYLAFEGFSDGKAKFGIYMLDATKRVGIEFKPDTEVGNG